MKEQKGITLVALVITIIILIILAAVSINMVLGDNGIMKKAQEGAIKSEMARENEAVQMTLAELRLSNEGKLLLDEATLKEAVERNANEDVTVTKGTGDNFVVKFTKSGREYEVTPDGEKPAGNKQTLVSQITTANYGDKVNYIVTANGVTLGKGDNGELDYWKIFYNDGETVTMIYGDYLPNSTNLATDAFLLKRTGEKYGVYSTSRKDCIAKLNDESKWSSLLNGNVNLTEKATARGTIDMDTLVNSWNENEKEYEKIYIAKNVGMGDGLDGYYIGNNENPTTKNVKADTAGYENKLYFPYNVMKDNTNGYWIAAPSGYTTDHMMFVGRTGYISYEIYSGNIFGIRPVISLSSSVLGEYDETTGAWNIE